MSPKERHSKKPKKNTPKNEGGWCTDDIEFDQEGAIYIKNPELARAIEDSRQAWGGFLNMNRDWFPEEEAEGGGVEGPKANMLCPCEPVGP